jgi:superfamily I DNA/RNA helicase
MSKPREIPPAVTERQTRASDPGSSAWVAANAGSGKTHVLAQRVIRLLLSGVDPGRILCITFTKAAAANMANRVYNDLRSWTVLDDAALDDAMRRTGENRIDARRRQRARQLFALALETPGGLKVHTIHAFCTQLLHLFPFEANVAARFEVLDETEENQLLEQLSLDVMLKAADAPDSPLGRALAQAVLAAADVTFRDLVRETIRQRDKLIRWVEAAGGVTQAMTQLSQTLGIGPDETAAQVEKRIFDDSLIASSEWAAVGAALNGGSKTDKDHGARFQALAALSGIDLLETYLDIFCTSVRDKVRDKIGTATMQKAHPSLCEKLAAERDRVWTLVQRRRAIEARDRSIALFTIAHAVIDRFRAEKDRRGLLDYEDLIDKTLDLLNNVSAAWVHYKLDRGIHHVLIDEAQDTSPKQWEIVKALVSEFFAGQGAHDRKRTIFAVGDEKQSIFSFQGAAPREFAAMRAHFEGLHKQAELVFVSTEFKHSFRSGENVLGAVDTVFSPATAHKGLTALPEAPVHEALPEAAPGVVEIWDTTKTDERKDVTPWDAPFDTERSASGVVKLAKRIAKHVALWRSRGQLAKDVLVLVRRRGVLFESIIRALKNEGVPVAGADRLVLTEHIAVMDLMALADALLLPQDDLALATVLKSPLFGLDEDELFTLAWERKSSLRNVLRTQWPDLSSRLDTLRQVARDKTPFAFYAELLGAGGGRRQLLGRLGHEAADALDEFLNLALDYERMETPSLQGFLAWLRGADRDPCRHHDAAAGLPSAAAAATAGGRRNTTAGVGGRQGAGRRSDGRGARGGARRGTRRISAASLRRDDARHRAADRVRRRWRHQAARRLLVRPHARCARRPVRRRTGRRWLGRSAALPQGARRHYPSAASKGGGAGTRSVAAMAQSEGSRRRAHRSNQTLRLRRRSGGGGVGPSARRAAARTPARQHRAPADAIAAGHSQGRAGRRRRPLYRTAENGFERSRARRDRRRRRGAPGRSALCRAVLARKPGRGSHRRPHRRPDRDRRGRPPGGRARLGPDRRLQDQPARAHEPGRDAGALSELCGAVGAVPRRAHAFVSRPAGPRRFGVDGHPQPGGNTRRSPGCGAGRPHHPVMPP